MTFPLAEHVDGMLLLIARGATGEEAAGYFGASERIYTRLAREYPDAVAAAIEARKHLRKPHGTFGRYSLGCRCAECRQANAGKQKGLRKKAAPPQHGTASAYRNHGCRCNECRAVGRSENRATQEKIRSGEYKVAHGTTAKVQQGCRCKDCSFVYEGVLRKNRDIQAASLDGAVHHKEEWTGPQLEIAARQDLTAREAAAMLGRTVNAVVKQRQLIFGRNPDPRKQAFL